MIGGIMGLDDDNPKEKFNNTVKRLSRKTNVNIYKSEKCFENKVKKFDTDLNEYVDSLVNDFDIDEQFLNVHKGDKCENAFIKKCKRKLDLI